MIPRGEEEAAEAGINLKLNYEFSPDIVLASPLTRTMQTAHIALRAFLEVSNCDQPLPQITACETAREGKNLNDCNRRSKKSELQLKFPDVDWTDVETEDDDSAGTEADLNLKEEIRKVSDRAKMLLTIFESKQASKILAFAHDGIIRVLYGVVIGLGYDHSVGSLKTGGVAELFFKERPDGSRFWSIGANAEIKISELMLFEKKS